MRYLPLILLACLSVAGLQSVASILTLAIVGTVAVGLIVRPRNTMAALGFLAFLSLLQTRPAAALALLAILVVAPWLLNRCGEWNPVWAAKRASSTSDASARQQPERLLPAPTGAEE